MILTLYSKMLQQTASLKLSRKGSVSWVTAGTDLKWSQKVHHVKVKVTSHAMLRWDMNISIWRNSHTIFTLGRHMKHIETCKWWTFQSRYSLMEVTRASYFWLSVYVSSRDYNFEGNDKKLVQRLCIASIAFCNEMSQVEVARLHEAQVWNAP